MEFKVSELEREPIDFDLEVAPGAVDLGEEAEQQGPLAASGHAEVLHEHRGPREIVADIRLRGRFADRKWRRERSIWARRPSSRGRWLPPAMPRCCTSTGVRGRLWPTSGSGAALQIG